MSAADTLRREIANEAGAEIADDVASQAQRQIAQSLAIAADVQQQLSASFKGGFSNLPADRRLYSLGEICRTFSIAPQSVRAICRAADILPVFLIDEKPFFDGAAFVSIGNHLREASE